MDINKEIAAFENHAQKFFKTDKAFEKKDNQYIYDEVVMMWDCWIEQAKSKQAEINDLKAKLEKTCKWSPDENLNWWTQCGNGFVFGDDPHPTSHNFKHCCYCGGVIEASQGEDHDNIE